MVTLLKKNLQQKAKRVAATYERYAEVEQEIVRRLLSRLSLMKINPQRILNYGARTGFSTRELRQHYPRAEIISCDGSEVFLQQTPKKFWQTHKSLVCADLPLPFQPRCFDLVIANLSPLWVSDIAQLLQEFYPLLRPNGLLLFATVGPDTLSELRALTSEDNRVHTFMDMHDIGDLLLQFKFEDPVMDMEALRLHYPNVLALFRELQRIGATNARSDQRRGLQGKKQWQALLDRYQAEFGLDSAGVYASLEIVYGHAWLPQQPDLQSINQHGEVTVPIATLKGRVEI